jgi:uncharacterized protein
MNQQLEIRMKAAGSKKILACDGGGILGLMSVEILAKIETDLRAKLGKNENFVLADYFDFVCGTSTGAIIAACIASGMSMDKVRQFYIDSGKQMFDKASVLKRLQYSYNDEPLAKLLRQAFDQQLHETDAKLGSANIKTLLMMVMRNNTTDSPWPVSNNPYAKYNARDRDDCNLELPLWQLVRASTAAPTYFPPEIVTLGKTKKYEFIFVDGGITAYNNPAYLAFQMATAKPYNVNWATGTDKLLIVSIGTGNAAKARPDLKADEMNLLYYATSIPSALMNAASAGWDMTCRMLGECRHGSEIDREFGDMVMKSPDEANWTGHKLFTYMRYDPDVTQDGLNALNLNSVKAADVQKMDSVDYMNDIKLVGSSYADRHVNINHFNGFV